MNEKIKILTVFGTRPEVIKLAPFIKEIEGDGNCISVTCATTQHRELQNDVLDLFEITPSYNLDVMRENQDLSYVTTAVLEGISQIILKEMPDFIVVQGDTTTAFSTALAAYYNKIPLVHIEAGLRTEDIWSPFPEEGNRRLISQMATLHMAPTLRAKENLENEGFLNNVYLVGNTIVDSVHWGLDNFQAHDSITQNILSKDSIKVLLTVHRRENFGKPLEEICDAIQKLCINYPTCFFIWPVHPNPNIYQVVHARLNEITNLQITTPLSYNNLLAVLHQVDLLISDSGGIQEEAAILGKKIIVLREETERQEIIDSGIGVLVGSNQEKIIDEFSKYINRNSDNQNALGSEIYGKPGVSKKILEEIKKYNLKKCL